MKRKCEKKKLVYVWREDELVCVCKNFLKDEVLIEIDCYYLGSRFLLML